MVVVAEQFIHAAAACARCPCLRHWVVFLKAPEDGFRIDDTGLTAVQVILFPFHAHGFLSSVLLFEEFSAVSADEI